MSEEKYIHKPGCPSPWMCNCYPTPSSPECPPAVQIQQDPLYDLSIVFKWLCERDNRCLPCIDGCVLEINNLNGGGSPMPLDGGHFLWMCEACRAEVDREGDSISRELNDLFKKGIKAEGKRRERLEKIYHVARCAYILGEADYPWYKVVHLIRRGLGIKGSECAPIEEYIKQVDPGELYDACRRLVDRK